MAHPGPVNPALAGALRRVPGLEQGASPLALRVLLGGTVNDVWAVQSPLGHFVLRLDGPAWRRPGVDRDREQVLHGLAAAAGLAPALVSVWPGVWVSTYLSGHCWSEAMLQERACLLQLCARLEQVHALPVPAVAPFSPWNLALEYARVVAPGPALGPDGGAGALEQLLARLRLALAGLHAERRRPAVIHGDLAPGNLLQGQTLWLLDWEYAQVGDPLLDLGCLLAYSPAAMAFAAELLAAAGLQGQADLRELRCATYVYAALNWLWYRARGEAPALPPVLASG